MFHRWLIGLLWGLIFIMAAMAYAAEEPVSPVTRELAETIGELKEGQKALQQQVGDLKSTIERGLQGVRQELTPRLDDLNAWMRVLTMVAVFTLVAMLLAVVGGAVAIWRQIGKIEGRLEGFTNTVEQLTTHTKHLEPTVVRLENIVARMERP